MQPLCVPRCQPICNSDCMQAYLVTLQNVPQCNFDQCPPHPLITLSQQFTPINSLLQPPQFPQLPINISPSIHPLLLSRAFYQPSMSASVLPVSSGISIQPPLQFVKEKVTQKNFVHPPPMPLQPPLPPKVSQVIQAPILPIKTIPEFSLAYFNPTFGKFYI